MTNMSVKGVFLTVILLSHLTGPIFDWSWEFLLCAVDDIGLLIVNESDIAQVEADNVSDLFEVLVFERNLVKEDAFTEMIDSHVFSLDCGVIANTHHVMFVRRNNFGKLNV